MELGLQKWWELVIETKMNRNFCSKHTTLKILNKPDLCIVQILELVGIRQICMYFSVLQVPVYKTELVMQVLHKTV